MANPRAQIVYQENGMPALVDVLERIPVLKTAFHEQQRAVCDVYGHAAEILRLDPTVPEQFRVTLDRMPDHVLGFQHNMFSTVFLGVLQPLGVPPARRLLYGKLNHLFRAWVTSADNLLDGEDKVTFAVRMPGKSLVMRQVVVLMLADRIMNRLLAQAQLERVITAAEAERLSDESLRVLLPSAAEEASEEGGLREWPTPEFVLNQIHPLKTGILFHIPFLGPEKIEQRIDTDKLRGLKAALLDFGIGCQMLDDVRDLARDFIQRRANYVIATLVHARDGAANLARLEALTASGDLEARLDQQFSDVTTAVCWAATDRLAGAFTALDKLGLAGFAPLAPTYIDLLIERLDLAHLITKPGVQLNETRDYR
jgi:hypothetical protein